MHVSVSPGPERTQETQEFRSPQLWSEFEAISKNVWKDFLLEQPLEGKAEGRLRTGRAEASLQLREERGSERAWGLPAGEALSLFKNGSLRQAEQSSVTDCRRCGYKADEPAGYDLV